MKFQQQQPKNSRYFLSTDEQILQCQIIDYNLLPTFLNSFTVNNPSYKFAHYRNILIQMENQNDLIKLKIDERRNALWCSTICR